MGIKKKRPGPSPNVHKPEWQVAVDEKGTWAGLRILIRDGTLPGPATKLIDNYLRGKRK